MSEFRLETLDWNLLRTLDALLQTRSPTSAARRLGLSQSAVSHALARLREALGDPLLVRTAAGMVPTERAALLAGPLREALVQIEAALQPQVFEPARAERSFRIASADYGQFLMLPLLTPQLRAAAPNVDVRMQAMQGRDGDAMLADGAVDLIFDVDRGGEGGSSSLRQRLLFEERFVCAARSGHPDIGDSLDLETFVRLPHALIAPTGTPGGVVDRILAERGLQRRVALTVPHFLVAPHVVASSDLLVTLAERLARAFAELLSLRMYEPPLALPGFRIVMRWHERQHRDPGHAWLRQQVLLAAERLDVSVG